MKRILGMFALAASCALSAYSQTTTYVGTIRDLANNVVTSGRITWAINAPSGGNIPGTGAFVSTTVSCLINASGSPVASSDGVSPCVITNNTSLTPTGTSYTLCIQPYNVSPGSCYTTFATGGTVNIATLVPTPATQPNYGVASTAANNTWSGANTFNGNATFGGTVTINGKTPITSKGVTVYASSKCALNSDIILGGGTDDSACLQGILDTMHASGGGTLIQDGVSLISNANVQLVGTPTTALHIWANESLLCGPGDGFFLAANSNVAMLGNTISGDPTTTNQEANIWTDGCIFNGNGANQSRYEQGNALNAWVVGLFFGHFNNLRISHTQVWYARTYSFAIMNGQNFVLDHDTELQLSTPWGGNNHDGIHMYGTLQHGYILDFQNYYGDDDSIAFNTDEAVYFYNNNPSAWQVSRYSQSGGNIDDVTVDGVFLCCANAPTGNHGVNSALRWIGYSTTNGVQTVSNIVLRNFYGQVTNFQSALTSVTATGGISIEDWNVTNLGATNILYTPASASPLKISNVLSGITITPGASSTFGRTASTTSGAFNNWQSVTITPMSAAGTGATAACVAGETCTPTQGAVQVTVGTSPTSGDVFKIAWTNPFDHKAMPISQAYDSTSSTAVSTALGDSGASSTTQCVFFTSSALTAAHSVTFNYTCM